jgi:hypothetical protein
MDENKQGDVERGDQPPPTTNAADKPKRTVKRKPLWLCVPKEYGEVVTDEGDIQRSPVTYELYECDGKGEVHKVLAKLGLDAKTLNPEHVKIFRADPLPLHLDTQVSIKF